MNEIPYNKAMTCKYQRIMELENTIEKEKTNNDKVCLCRSSVHSDRVFVEFQGSFKSRFT